jgi:hypothetical protein
MKGLNMRLSARIIRNYVNNNSFQYADNINIRAKEPATFWFQLIDLDNSSLRYISAFTPSQLAISVKFKSVDYHNEFSLPAVIASTDDKSIWYIQLDGTKDVNSGNLFFNFVENGISRNFYLLDVLKVEQMEVGAC